MRARHIVPAVLLVLCSVVAAGHAPVSAASAAPTSPAAPRVPPNGSGHPPLVHHGGPVQDDPQVYLVFWGPLWATESTHAQTMAKVQEVFQNLGGTSYNNTLRQYVQRGDQPGKQYNRVRVAGTWLDTQNDRPQRMFIGVPNLPLVSGGEIKDEADRAYDHFQLTPNLNTQVIVFPQSGSTYRKESVGPITLDMEAACGMHSIDLDRALPYALVRFPKSGSECDSTTKPGFTPDIAKNVAWTAVHEYAEMVTDPVIYWDGLRVTGTGWHTDEGLTASLPEQLLPQEVSDLCELRTVAAYDPGRPEANYDPTVLIPGSPSATYALPFQWSNWTGRCEVAAGETFPSPETDPAYNYKHTVQGAILDRYRASGGYGAVGAPLSEELSLSGGAVSYFQTGCWDSGPYGSGHAIYSGPARTQIVRCGIYAHYLSLGGPDGPLGYPNSDEYPTADGAQSDFQYGSITWDESVGPREHLGGTEEPVVIRNQDGRMEAFQWAPTGELWHAWQVRPNDVWTGWASLGGRLSGKPTVAMNADGRLEVVARGTDNALYHIWQTSPGGNWSGWSGLGGNVRQDPKATWSVPGPVEVFVRGDHDDLQRIRQTSPGGGWSGFSSLGGGLTSSPSPIVTIDGPIDVAVRGTNSGGMWHLRQNGAGGSFPGSFSSLGCCSKSEVVTVRNYDGRLEAFIQGTDDILYHRWEEYRNGPWSGWASLGGARLAAPPAVAINILQGTLEVFIRTDDGTILHRVQLTSGGDWSGWMSLGCCAASRPFVQANHDGRLEVFIRGTDGRTYHQWQLQPSGSWSGWAGL